MNSQVKYLLIQILPSVRAKMEEVAELEDFSNDLCGLCARSAAITFKLLKMFGLNPLLCVTWGHVFVLLDDYVVDVTATQFEYEEKIFIRHKEDNISRFYNTNFQFLELEAAIQKLQDMSWVESQMPKSSEYEEISSIIFEEFQHIQLAEIS